MGFYSHFDAVMFRMKQSALLLSHKYLKFRPCNAARTCLLSHYGFLRAILPIFDSPATRGRHASDGQLHFFFVSYNAIEQNILHQIAGNSGLRLELKYMGITPIF